MAVDPAQDPPAPEWDVFVSYSSKDAGWVLGEFYPALRALRTTAGRRPSIFVDTAEEGIPPAVNWVDYLSVAVQRSRFFVAVYSSHYFHNDICDLEITWALQRHARRGGFIVPIVLDSAALTEVPYKLNQIAWLKVTTLDWFDRLRRHLGLVADHRRSVLRMSPVPGEIVVNHTLPTVRVELIDGDTGRHVPDAGPVTIRAEPPSAGLRGTLLSSAENGLASFGDLSFLAAHPEVRLVVEVPGGESLIGESFAVVDHARSAAPHLAPVEIPLRVGECARLRFFPDGRTLAVVGGDDFGIYSDQGMPLSHTRIAGPVRLWASGEKRLAVADWSGQVVLGLPDGTAQVCRFDDGSAGLSVPGAMCFAGDRLYVGMWSGAIWMVDPDSPAPRQVLHHPAGVQTLTRLGDQLVFVDLDGRLMRETRGGGVVRVVDQPLESVVLGMWAAADCAVAVGTDRVYRVDIDPPDVIPRKLPVSAVATAAAESSCFLVGADGRGLRFDQELNVHGGFWVAPGAEPVELDRAGEVAVFAYPDGSYALMVSERIVLTHLTGPVAVTPDGSRVAIAEESGIRFTTLGELAP